MKITGSFEAFKGFLNHLPHRGAGIFLYQTTPDGKKVTDVLVEDREWHFPVNDRPTVEWVRSFSNAAILVDSWTL